MVAFKFVLYEGILRGCRLAARVTEGVRVARTLQQQHPVTPGDAGWKHTSLPRTPCHTGRRGMKTHKSSKNTLFHRATRNANTPVLQENPVTPRDAEWKYTSLPRTPCYIGRRGMKRQQSSKNTLLHRATRNEKTEVFQEHPVTPGDAEWKDRSLPRTPCYTGRRGMKRQKSSKNTLLHRATRNEKTEVFQEHPVSPGDAECKHTNVTRTPCYTGRRGNENIHVFQGRFVPNNTLPPAGRPPSAQLDVASATFFIKKRKKPKTATPWTLKWGHWTTIFFVTCLLEVSCINIYGKWE